MCNGAFKIGIAPEGESNYNNAIHVCYIDADSVSYNIVVVAL